MAIYWEKDLKEYPNFQWNMIAVFHDLVHSNFIKLNITTGEAYQIRDFKTGRNLYDVKTGIERPERMCPVRMGDYLCLQAEVKSSPTESRTVVVRLHKLVWLIATGDLPRGKDIHHKDDNTDRCGFSNLVALYPHEHKEVHKRNKHPNSRPRIYRGDPVVERILQLHESKCSLREIEKKVGFSYSTCRRIINGTYPFEDPAAKEAREKDVVIVDPEDLEVEDPDDAEYAECDEDADEVVDEVIKEAVKEVQYEYPDGADIDVDKEEAEKDDDYIEDEYEEEDIAVEDVAEEDVDDDEEDADIDVDGIDADQEDDDDDDDSYYDDDYDIEDDDDEEDADIDAVKESADINDDEDDRDGLWLA